MTKPVDLTDEDPEVFQAYLNCVYFGPQTLREHGDEFERQLQSFHAKLFVYSTDAVDEASLERALAKFGHVKSIELRSRTYNVIGCYYRIEFDTAEGAAKAFANIEGHMIGDQKFRVFVPPTSRLSRVDAPKSGFSQTGFESLIKLYLLADKLQDLTTANMVMGELIRFAAQTNEIPRRAAISLAYDSTTESNPIRTLLRDYWVYQSPADGISQFKTGNFPKEFLQDVGADPMLLRLGKATTEDCKRDECTDKCLYHQHDDEHPRCGAQ